MRQSLVHLGVLSSGGLGYSCRQPMLRAYWWGVSSSCGASTPSESSHRRVAEPGITLVAV